MKCTGWEGFIIIKIIHMWRRWGAPQNFCLAIIHELEKQLFIKKTVEVGQKNVRILIFKMLYFKKNTEKHLEISLFYTCVPKILMIWSTVPENFEKMKKIAGDIIILHKCTKNHDHMARDGCNCYFSFRTIFYPFTSLTAPKIKI